MGHISTPIFMPYAFPGVRRYAPVYSAASYNEPLRTAAALSWLTAPVGASAAVLVNW